MQRGGELNCWETPAQHWEREDGGCLGCSILELSCASPGGARTLLERSRPCFAPPESQPEAEMGVWTVGRGGLGCWGNIPAPIPPYSLPWRSCSGGRRVRPGGSASVHPVGMRHLAGTRLGPGGALELSRA